MLHIYRQITGLRRWRPVVFCQKREEAARFPFADVVRLPSARTRALRRLVVRQILRRPVQLYPGEARRLAAEIQRVGGRVLHIYFGHIAVQLLPILRRPPVPVVISFHGADAGVELGKPAFRRATEEALQLARLVLVRSESLAARLVELGCEREKIRLHRTGIPLERFPFAPRTPPANGAWRFFQACRLIPKKGLAVSLRAFADFARRHENARFVIAGEGTLLEELRTLAAELGVGERVTFTGFLAQNDLKSELDAAHIFLHPSELGADGNQEGVPNAMLEAMATGLPVLATRHGGIPEAVEHEKSGLLVAEGDHVALAKAMEELTASPERYQSMAAAAAKAVQERFEQSRQAAVLEACYDEAL